MDNGDDYDDDDNDNDEATHIRTHAIERVDRAGLTVAIKKIIKLKTSEL